jgi:hypothetical protein
MFLAAERACGLLLGVRDDDLFNLGVFLQNILAELFEDVLGDCPVELNTEVTIFLCETSDRGGVFVHVNRELFVGLGVLLYLA